MAIKKRIIRLPNGKVQQMAQALGCSPATVYNALAYSTDNDRAQLIRKQAIELYGGVVESRTIFA